MGTISTVAAADICPQRIPLIVTKPTTPTGSVTTHFLVKIKASKNSFQQKRKVTILVAVRHGLTKGNMSLKKSSPGSTSIY